MTPLVGNQGVIFNACHFYSSMCEILDIFVEQIMLRKINLNVSQWNIANYWSETLPTCCGRGLWGGGGGRCVHMDTIMMVQATKWVCQKNLWDETTINLAWYDSDGNGEGDVGTNDEGWQSRRDDTMTTTTLMTTMTNKMTKTLMTMMTRWQGQPDW